MARPLLLVEDSEDDIFFMKKAMEKADIRNPLAVTKDGREAIEYLEKALDCKHPDLPVPCLILLDFEAAAGAWI